MRRNWQPPAAACLLLLVLLGLRVKSYFYGAEPPPGFAGSVLVAGRDMKAGHVIQRGGFYGALLSPCRDCFDSDASVEGLILAQPVGEQNPLRHEGVLRMQVVAKKDVEPNAAVTADAVGLAWSPFHPDAALRTACVINGKSRQGMRGGNVILESLMTGDRASPECAGQGR